MVCVCVSVCVCARAFYTQTSRLLYDLPAKVLKSLDEPMMTAKAYCGRVITEWLSHELVLATRGLLRGDLETRWVCVTVILADTRLTLEFANARLIKQVEFCGLTMFTA